MQQAQNLQWLGGCSRKNHLTALFTESPKGSNERHDSAAVEQAKVTQVDRPVALGSLKKLIDKGNEVGDGKRVEFAAHPDLH